MNELSWQLLEDKTLVESLTMQAWISNRVTGCVCARE